jgi:hypothetical protein
MAQAFEQVINLQLAQFSPEEAKRRHIAIARSGLATYLAGHPPRPGVMIEVDGHAATSEESVKPFGVIVYRFQRMREIALFALNAARTLSPVLRGRYKASWFALVNNRETAPEAIGAADTVIITNDQPYARKIQVGARGFEKYVPPGIVEKVRQLVIRKYGAIVDVALEFITLVGGYVLRATAKGSRGRRKDSQAGAAMKYPALVLTPKRFV